MQSKDFETVKLQMNKKEKDCIGLKQVQFELIIRDKRNSNTLTVYQNITEEINSDHS